MPVRENKPKPEQQVVVVTFKIGSQTYALPLGPVRQIIEMITITPLPQVNPMISGVINFHGVMAPVVNMRRLLELEELPLGLHTPIILVNVSKRLVGLIVDTVIDVLELPVDQVVDPNHILLKDLGETPLLQGLIQTKTGSILMLNPEHLFKPYHTRALSEAIDTLVQNSEEPVPGGTVVPVVAEAPAPAQEPARPTPLENAPAAKSSRSSQRKKATSEAKTREEGAR